MPDDARREPTKRPQKAPWRRGIDSAERSVGGRLESLVQSSEFAAGLSIARRLDTGVRRLVGNQTARILHVLNIPTLRDVRSLHEHLNAVDAHMSEVIREQEKPTPRRPARTDDAGPARVRKHREEPIRD